jgi:hypothetical protein
MDGQGSTSNRICELPFVVNQDHDGILRHGGHCLMPRHNPRTSHIITSRKSRCQAAIVLIRLKYAQVYEARLDSVDHQSQFGQCALKSRSIQAMNVVADVLQIP